MITTIQESISHWQNLADRKAAFSLAVGQHDASLSRDAAQESLQASRVVEALKMEARTGVVHCSCTTPPHPINR
jgi:hypothetical protein